MLYTRSATLAAWRYQWAPEDGKPESVLYTDFLRPRGTLRG